MIKQILPEKSDVIDDSGFSQVNKGHVGIHICAWWQFATYINQRLLQRALSTQPSYANSVRSFVPITLSCVMLIMLVASLYKIRLILLQPLYLISIAVTVKGLYWRRAEIKPDERSVIRLCAYVCALYWLLFAFKCMWVFPCSRVHVWVWICGLRRRVIRYYNISICQAVISSIPA